MVKREEDKKVNADGILAMNFGILSLVFSITGIFGLVLGVIGAIFGSKAKRGEISQTSYGLGLSVLGILISLASLVWQVKLM
jgi:uncharacterized Tic20 family protein